LHFLELQISQLDKSPLGLGAQSASINMRDHSDIIIRGGSQGPLYIIGGGTVRYSTAKQRTFDPHNASRLRLLEPACGVRPDQYLSYKWHALTTRLEAVSLTWWKEVQAFFYCPRLVRLYSCSAVLQWTIYNCSCVSAGAIEWIGVVCMMYALRIHRVSI
jgi:hypothetical protein